MTEWEWSPKDSGWIYKMPRPDKSKPNFSRTVLATIMELAEGMEIQELEYRLTFARQERTLTLLREALKLLREALKLLVTRY